jgi:hypothetical protein
MVNADQGIDRQPNQYSEIDGTSIRAKWRFALQDLIQMEAFYARRMRCLPASQSTKQPSRSRNSRLVRAITVTRRHEKSRVLILLAIC